MRKRMPVIRLLLCSADVPLSSDRPEKSLDTKDANLFLDLSRRRRKEGEGGGGALVSCNPLYVPSLTLTTLTTLTTVVLRL